MRRAPKGNSGIRCQSMSSVLNWWTIFQTSKAARADIGKTDRATVGMAAFETCLTSSGDAALALQRPAANDAMRVVATGEKKDG